MKSLDNYDDVLDIKDVAEYLNISKPLVRKLCLNNKIKYIRIGWLYKITKDDLKAFINQNKCSKNNVVIDSDGIEVIE